MSRETFEAWFKSSFHPDITGPYVKDQLFCAWQAAIASMQSERDHLAAQLADVVAENAALKALNEDRRVFIMNGVQLGYIKVPTVETDPALETIRIAVSPQEKTPATDRFLAEQRAIGVEMFADYILCPDLDEEIRGYADWLRNEVNHG